MVYFGVALGSALGGMGRFWLTGLVGQRLGETFPWGTLVVNASGSFLIGCFAAVTGPDGRWMVHSRFNSFFTAGLCGGYTTFSSFSVQTLRLAQEGESLHAGAYVVASVVLCLAAVWAGHAAGQFLNRC